MEKLKEIENQFEKIKNDDNISAEQKSIEYAKLMTALETSYNIPMTANEEFEALPTEVKELYSKISSERKF